MVVHEPLLYVQLVKEKAAEQSPSLKVQHSKSMAFGNFPDASISEYLLRQDGSHAIEQVVDDPVEHFQQEREALQYSAMHVVSESGCVGCFEGKAEQVSLIANMVRCNHVFMCIVIVSLVMAQRLATEACSVITVQS